MKRNGLRSVVTVGVIVAVVCMAAPASADSDATTTTLSGPDETTSTTELVPVPTAAPALAPVTTPTITAPVDAATVADDVPITATSSAPTVQFYLDNVAFGAPVAVDSGAAIADWPTWGSVNASHTWTAADCDTDCNVTLSSPVSVTLANLAPSLTSPTDGATTSTNVTLHADATGGGIAFFVDGNEVGFDGTAPYSLAVNPAPNGVHSAYAVPCDALELTCLGPVSSTVSFTVKSLHPTITSVSPNPFSPHHDGRGDTTTFRIHLPDAEHVSFSIIGPHGSLVSGPHTPGTLGAGGHPYHWDGRTNARKFAGDGLYTISVDTTRSVSGVTLHGKATASVRVDNTPASLTGVTGSGFTFYPVTDGYIDKFEPKVTVNEGGGLWLDIYNTAGTRVREIAHPHGSKGTFKFSWDGRNASGHMQHAGTYRYFFKAQDPAGNRRNSANFHLVLRHERLVNKTATLLRNGDQYTGVDLTAPCTGASLKQSGFAHGLWLVNVCNEAFDGFQSASAVYTVTAPHAIRYNTIRLRSYGNTVSPPEAVLAIIYNWSSGWKGVGAKVLTKFGTSEWSGFGTLPAAHLVSGSRAIRVAIGIGDENAPEDYDLGRVEITVSYSVLHL